MDVHTVRTFAVKIGRSDQFVRRAIDLGRLKAERVGGRWLLLGSEAKRFNDQPFQISREEMFK